jgi:hypothetical protein
VSSEGIVWTAYRGVATAGIAAGILLLFWKSLPPSLPSESRRRLVYIVCAAVLLKVFVLLFWYADVRGVYVDPSVQDQYAYMRGGEYVAAQLHQGVLPPPPARVT